MLRSSIDDFIMDRQISGCTPKTLTWHKTALGRFHQFLDAEQVADLDSLSPSIIRRYIAHLQSSGLSAASVATYTRSLFAFTKWLHEEGLTDQNVQGNVKRPRQPQQMKEPFTDEEITRLLTACKRSDYPLRDVAIFSLMFDCGLRAGEITSLEMRRLHLDQQMLVVRGKGQKDRVVPFSLQTSRALRRYISRERPKSAEELVFTTRQGRQFHANTLLQMVTRRALQAGVTDAHPHRFRHTFAVSYLRNGGDGFTLQRILGHTTPTMTNRYLNFTGEDLLQRHTAASPLSNLDRKGST